MKPRVIAHMMSPVDGRVKVEGWARSSGHSLDELVSEYVRIHDTLGGDAWIVGRSTGEEFATADPHPPRVVGEVDRPIHVATKRADEFAIALDNDGKLHWPAPDVDGAPVIVLLGAGVPDAPLAELAADGVSYIVSEADRIDLRAALVTLTEVFGIETLLLEGGAHTYGTFLDAQLVDELSIVLFPAISGATGSTSTIEAGEAGLADKVCLKRLSFAAGGLDSIRLRYAVSYVD